MSDAAPPDDRQLVAHLTHRNAALQELLAALDDRLELALLALGAIAEDRAGPSPQAVARGTLLEIGRMQPLQRTHRGPD